MHAFEMRRKARAFVLVDTEPGKEEEVLKKLIELDEVKEGHIVPGEHDIILILEFERELIAPVEEKIMRFVTSKVATAEGVKDTHTIIPSYSLTKWIRSA